MLFRNNLGRFSNLAIVFAFGLVLTLPALSQQAPAPTAPKKPQPAPTGEAGGPQGDIGPIVLPKKTEEAPPPPRPEKPKPVEGMPDVTITKNVNVVQVPVLVTTKDGQFIPNLKQDNFRIFEDGVPQKISKMDISEAPITAVLLVEFANRNYQFMYDALNASYSFVNLLKKDDWVAVISFDMRTYILSDFTQDKGQVLGALNQLRIPGFSETNLFDALYDTLDRVERVDGRKYVVLIASGCDTFSRITYDKVLKKVKDTPNVTIFTISTGEALRLWAEAQGMGNQGASVFPCSTGMDFLQADNQMSTFARLTGGRWFKPRFEAEMPEIFHDVAANIRNQYVLTYHPTNPKLDGTFRKLKVEVVAPDGAPLKVKNQKGKEVKFQILARDGYTAKHEVE